jgi:hypothetical protein
MLDKFIDSLSKYKWWIVIAIMLAGFLFIYFGSE